MGLRGGGGAPRKLKADDFLPGVATQVSISLDGGELIAIDKALRKLNKADGPEWTRSMVIRKAVREWLVSQGITIPTRESEIRRLETLVAEKRGIGAAWARQRLARLQGKAKGRKR